MRDWRVVVTPQNGEDPDELRREWAQRIQAAFDNEQQVIALPPWVDILFDKPTPKPSVGRIVHYVLGGAGLDQASIPMSKYGEHRPAMIVRVWSDLMVQLQVFTDGYNDRPNHPDGLMWRTSIHQDEDTKASGTWHWPERED